MGFIITIFNEALYKPLFNGLVLIYNVLPIQDFGIAIIIFTLIVRFVMYPLSKKSIQSQKALTKLQPQIKEIQAKYKKEKDKQAQELMKLYKENKVNPMSGCLPLLIQFPVFIALYRVFYDGFKPETLDNLYGAVARPEALNPIFLGVLDLSEASIVMAVLAGIFMFVQSKMMLAQTKSSKKKSMKIGGVDFSAMMGKQMTYVLPVFMVFLFSSLPAALALYLIVTTLFGIVQQHFTKLEKNKEPNRQAEAA